MQFLRKVLNFQVQLENFFHGEKLQTERLVLILKDSQDDVEDIRVGEVRNVLSEVRITSLEVIDDIVTVEEIIRLITRLRLVCFKVDRTVPWWSLGTGQSHYLGKVLSNLTKYPYNGRHWLNQAKEIYLVGNSVVVVTVIKAESEPAAVLISIATKLTPEKFLSPAEQVEVLLVDKDKTTSTK